MIVAGFCIFTSSYVRLALSAALMFVRSEHLGTEGSHTLQRLQVVSHGSEPLHPQ